MVKDMVKSNRKLSEYMKTKYQDIIQDLKRKDNRKQEKYRKHGN